MTRKAMVIGLLAVGAAALVVAPAVAQDRISSTEKGSVLIFPKVEVMWDCTTGAVLQDTFVDMTNDYPDTVLVQMYFINGDESTVDEPGCNWVDVQIELTGNEPTYWSAATGLPKGVSPWSVLDPGPPPGRPHPDFPNVCVLRGYVVAWAVNAVGEEIVWNHLKGDAMILDYAFGTAWEYNAYAAAAILGRTGTPPQHGDLVATPGELRFDGVEYDFGFQLLLLDFYAPGFLFTQNNLFGFTDTDLTLLPMRADLRQDNDGPVITKAKFDIWNQNEVKFSGTERCITCWDQAWLTRYDAPNHFLQWNLQTAKGKARIDGMASTVCEGSTAEPLLGVSMTALAFCSHANDNPDIPARTGGFVFANAAKNLVGMGFDDTAVILADIVSEPPPIKPTRGGVQVGEATPLAR